MPIPTGKDGKYREGVCPALDKHLTCGQAEAAREGGETYDCDHNGSICPMRQTAEELAAQRIGGA